jgi:anaerobic magnesium-protoporphyrin IX monomethyl ester cyclase
VPVCQAVGSRPILHDANCRADIGAEGELLSTLHKAGARLFCVGFESGDVEVINGMKKRPA